MICKYLKNCLFVVLCVYLLSGCSISTSLLSYSSPTSSTTYSGECSPTQNPTSSSSDSETISSSTPESSNQMTTFAPSASMEEGNTKSDAALSLNQISEHLDDICQTGYLFFRQCQIGQEGILEFDLEDQFIQDDQQYIAVASFASEENFLTFCRNYYSDSFINQNILPWFDGAEPQFLEKGGRLYYKIPSGTGLVAPLATQKAVIESQGPDFLSISMPLWNPQIELPLDATVKITLICAKDAWKISEIQECSN